jgi:hypothetical protein
MERPCPQTVHYYPARQSRVLERQMLKACDSGLIFLLSRRLVVVCGVAEIT